jgi:hypothetical protein
LRVDEVQPREKGVVLFGVQPGEVRIGVAHAHEYSSAGTRSP